MDFIIELFNVLSDQLFPNDTTRVYAIAPAAMFALQAIPSVFQYFGSRGQKEQGIKDLRKAEQAQADAISAMRAVEIQNKLQSLQVPTLGAEVRERGITRGLAGGVEAAQEGGPEAIIGGLPKMQAQADVASAQIAGDLDRLEAERDRRVLMQDQAIEMEKKQRELDIQNMILGGAGLAAADAQRLQQMGQYGQMQALAGIGTAGVAALNPYGRQPKEKAVDTTTSISPTASMGQTGMSGLARNQVFDPTVTLQGLNDSSMTFNQIGQYNPITQGMSLTPTTPTSFQPSYFQSLMEQNASFDPTVSLFGQYQNPASPFNTRIK